MSDKDESMIIEECRVPDEIIPGRYNKNGQPDDRGSLFLGMGSGIVHMWSVFDQPLKPGQMATMDFKNTFGSYSLTGNFTEWQEGPGPFSPHTITRKQLGDPLGRSPLLAEAGEWVNQVSVFEHGPDQDPTPITGSETNSLMRSFTGDLWVNSDYTAIFHGLPFKQYGLYGYDHNTRKYHAAWVKSAQSNLSLFEGDYDPATRTLTLEGETRNCFGKTDANGVVFKVKERRIIHYVDRNTKITEVFQEDDPGGRWVRRDKIYSKRKGSGVGNAPTLSDVPMVLVGLQRAYQIVRVIGQNAGNSARRAAAGMVMLGPQWNAVFKDDVRL